VFDFIGEPAGTRTQDHLIKSQVLYQLSYGLAAADVEACAGPVNSKRRIGALAVNARCANTRSSLRDAYDKAASFQHSTTAPTPLERSTPA
jgi:hypothetical protein